MKIQPKTKQRLIKIIDKTIYERGSECDLNFIDVSEITDMSALFLSTYYDFNGDISQWNISNVTNMSYMFSNSIFNGDISKWDISNVKDTSFMFEKSEFNNDISKWNTSSVTNASGMFYNSVFNQDISKWNTSNIISANSMFYNSVFNQDISKWNIDKLKYFNNMYLNSKLLDEYKPCCSNIEDTVCNYIFNFIKNQRIKI